MMAKTYLDQLG